MCGEGGAGAGERDVNEVLLVAQAPEGGDHGRVEVVPAQRVLLLPARARADRGAACASQAWYNQGYHMKTCNIILVDRLLNIPPRVPVMTECYGKKTIKCFGIYRV